MVVVQAALFCKEIGVNNVIVEGDASTIIKALQEEEPNGSRYGHFIEEARMIFNSLPNWQPNHVRRSLNGVVHCLAKLATKSVIDKI
jgi:hypothetical protein